MMNWFWFFTIKDTENPIRFILLLIGVVNKSIILLISFIIRFVVLLINEQLISGPREAGSRGVFMDALKRVSTESRIETGWG